MAELTIQQIEEEAAKRNVPIYIIIDEIVNSQLN